MSVYLFKNFFIKFYENKLRTFFYDILGAYVKKWLWSRSFLMKFYSFFLRILRNICALHSLSIVNGGGV